jgi:hypothetical protein
MFCGECGTQNPDTNAFCKNCGKPVKRSVIQGPPQNVTATAAGAAPPVPVASAGATIPAQPVSVHPAGIIGTIWSRKTLVGSIVFSLASLLIFPYIFGALAILLGLWTVYKKDKWGVAGIVTGLLVILVDYFYIVLFP